MNKVKIWIFKCWKNSLFKASVLGLVFAVTTYYIATRCGLANEILKISIALLTLGLPFFFLWIFRIYNTRKQLNERVIEWILNDRIKSLFWAGVLGIGLAIIAYIAADCSCNKIFQSSITLLFLGLPTFFTLWVFRTHDVQEQLDKAEKQLDKAEKQIKKTEENTNNNTFFECVRMLMFEAPPESDEKDRIKNSFHKKVALEQLAYLKRETGFDKKRIDLLTKSLSSLNTTELNYARLSGINLSDMNLIGISLIDADLSNADLSDLPPFLEPH